MKVEWGTRNVKNELVALGMGSAFQKADGFNRIGDNIRISEVLHKTGKILIR